MCNACERYKAILTDIVKENKEKKILPWYGQTKSTHKERLEKKRMQTEKNSQNLI